MVMIWDMTIVKEPEDYRQIPFKKLYKMFGEDVEMDFDYCCVCKIPKEFIGKAAIKKQ